jgi:hypothetical protein
MYKDQNFFNGNVTIDRHELIECTAKYYEISFAVHDALSGDAPASLLFSQHWLAAGVSTTPTHVMEGFSLLKYEQSSMQSASDVVFSSLCRSLKGKFTLQMMVYRPPFAAE